MIDKTNPYYYYYSVGDKIFSNKFFALAANPNNKNLNIKFHVPNIESEFLKINLYEEPEESLEELYKNRAIQLRNDYDYLVLFYSGGYDSHNILETFMRNNIFLDEIIVSDFIDFGDSNNLDDESLNFLITEGRFLETQKSAIPLAKFYVENFSPHTKITYFSKVFKEHLNFWSNNENKINLCGYGNISDLIANRAIWRTINPNLYNKEWRKIREIKKTAFIWGREKPDVKVNNFGYFFHFNDALFLNCFGPKNNECIDKQPLYHEYFYIHPKAVKMFVKIAHTMIKKLPINFFAQNRTLDTRQYQDKISNVIYDIKTPIPYTEPKPADLFTKFLNNPKKYPKLLKMAEFTGLDSLKIVGPSVSNFFINNVTIQASINHKNFVNLISENFSIKINQLSKEYVTDSFYFNNTLKNYV